MSDYIVEEALALASDQDISVPAFVQIDPNTGKVGLNYLGLIGGALSGNPPRYWGEFSYRSVIPGLPIAATSVFQPGDIISLIAADSPILRRPTNVWQMIAVQSNEPPNAAGENWLFTGGSPIRLDKLTTDNYTSNSVWLADTGLGSITIPFTGTYRVQAWAFVGASTTVSAQTSELGIFTNGSLTVALTAFSWTTNNLDGTMSFDTVESFSRNDVVQLGFFNNTPGVAPMFERALAITPIQIPNTQ